MDQLPRLGKRELIGLLSFTCNYVVFVWRGFLFLWVLGMGYVILLWHSLSLPYNYFVKHFKNYLYGKKFLVKDGPQLFKVAHEPQNPRRTDCQLDRDTVLLLHEG